MGKKAKKQKRRSHTTDAIKDLQRVDASGKPLRSGTLPNQPVQSQQMYPTSGLNWSVPEDLPGVVGSSSPTSSQTPSLDSMFISLGPHPMARVSHYASDPDFMHVGDSMEAGHYLVYRTMVGSCDVAVQVGAKEEVQRFPTPPVYSSSAGSTIPGIRCISPSPSSSSQTNSRHGTPVKNLPPVFEGASMAARHSSPLAFMGRERETKKGRRFHESQQVPMYEHYGGIAGGQEEALPESDDEDDTYGECWSLGIPLLMTA